jgi:radical SAM protein with 4Fe4S-binding SPASM domain
MTYKETKTAPNLKEVIIRDPFEIMNKKFGGKYKEYRKNWKIAVERTYVPDFPIHLDIDISDSCNLACDYCLQYKSKCWSGIDMKLSVFKKIIEEVNNKADSINIGCNAEPLLNKDLFFKVLDILDKSNFIDIFIHTNAVNLTEDVQKRILESKITTVCFSMGGVNSRERINFINKIKYNIINFKTLRDKLGKDLPLIRISIIPTEENLKEIDNYKNFWKKYADYIEFQDIASLENKDSDIFKKKKFICIDPWRRMSITSNGDIYPCCAFTCFNKELILGNINKININEAWKSKKMLELRKTLKSDKINYAGCYNCLRSKYTLGGA